MEVDKQHDKPVSPESNMGEQLTASSKEQEEQKPMEPTSADQSDTNIPVTVSERVKLCMFVHWLALLFSKKGKLK